MEPTPLHLTHKPIVELGELYGMKIYIQLDGHDESMREHKYRLALSAIHKAFNMGAPKNNSEELEWARPFLFEQCRAVKEPNLYHGGRCELRKGHKGDHALEMGMDIPRWSTAWTS